MTTINVDAASIVNKGPINGVVRISAKNVQYSGSTTLVPQFIDFEMVNGRATITNAKPGEAVIQIRWGFNREVSVRVTVPETGTFELSALTLQNYDQEPAIVSQVVASANKAAEADKNATKTKADIVSLLSQVKQAVTDTTAKGEEYLGKFKTAVSTAAASLRTELADLLVDVQGAATRSESAADRSAEAAAAEVAKLTADAPEAFDTLREIANELNAGATDRAALTASIAAKADRVHTHEISDIWDLQERLAAAGTKEVTYASLLGKPATFPPDDHGHPVDEITDATTVTRTLLKASTAAAARSAIGAGTSSLALGTTSSTAAAGNHTHAGMQETIDKVAAATTNPEGNTLALRNPDGTLSITEGIGGNHATTAGYVNWAVTNQHRATVVEMYTGVKTLNATESSFQWRYVSNSGVASIDTGLESLTINTTGLYQINYEVPYGSHFTGITYYGFQVKAAGSSTWAVKKFAGIENRSNWDRTDTMTWTIPLTAGNSIRIVQATSASVQAGVNTKYSTRATLAINRIG